MNEREKEREREREREREKERQQVCGVEECSVSMKLSQSKLARDF